MGLSPFSPSYYQLEDTNAASINNHLSSLVESSLSELERSHCLAIEDVSALLTVQVVT